MLTYSTLQDRPREFLAATSLTHEEFARVLPAFAAAYAVLYPPDKTWEGKVRQRQSGGGAKGGLPQMADKLFFILVYQKTHPLQTMHGLQFELSQPQTHYWIHRLLPVLQRALAALGMAPERDEERLPIRPTPRSTRTRAFRAMSLRASSRSSPKKPKGQELSVADRFLNHLISSARVVVENVIAGVKRCRIVKDVLRLTKAGMSDLVMEIACGLHNLRVSCRHPFPTCDVLSLVSSG